MGRANLPVVVVERMGKRILAKVGDVPGQLFVGQRLRSTDELAGDAASGPSFAEAMLNGPDLRLIPVPGEGGEDPARGGNFAVPVRRAPPAAHRGEGGRLERGALPLVHREV